MALSQKEIEININELETRLERLRHLYDQYFLGFEKLAPEVPRKDVERRIAELRRDQIRNTALRFRFQVITQKYQTYQSFWTRICRQIEEGTFKRHLQRAAKRFGVNAKKGRIDFDLDIDVDLGELDVPVEEEAMDDGLSDDDRRILREVEAEMNRDNSSPDTDRPAPGSQRARPAIDTPPVPPSASKFANEDDDDDDDLPTNRPPSSVTAERLALSMPKNPVPQFTDRPQNAASFAPGTAARPVIRKATEVPPGRTLSGTMPQIRRSNASVMPLVAPAPQKAVPPPPARESAGRIALPVPGAPSRKPPENMPSPESASMRAAPEKSAIRSSPQEATQAQQTQLAQQPRVAGVSVPGRPSGQMRAAAPVATRDAPPPSSSSKSSKSKRPPPSQRSTGLSKPPPPLPSTITTRGRPNLADLADATKQGEKDKK